jgi:hypothetical protein
MEAVSFYNVTPVFCQANKTWSAVRTERTLSSFFENKTGLKKGDSLSPILFNLVI